MILKVEQHQWSTVEGRQHHCARTVSREPILWMLPLFVGFRLMQPPRRSSTSPPHAPRQRDDLIRK